MLDDMEVWRIAKRWDCSRQAVHQKMKRFGKVKMSKRGYKNGAYFSGEDVRYVEANTDLSCRP